jgi:curved DNA-binding protein CbpA
MRKNNDNEAQTGSKADSCLYEILEVSPKARPAVIRAAYRCLVQEYHPDKNPDNAAAAAHMSLINHAYTVLADPLLRARYDKKTGVRPAERRGSGLSSTPVKRDAGKSRPNLRPFAFRPLD